MIDELIGRGYVKTFEINGRGGREVTRPQVGCSHVKLRFLMRQIGANDKVKWNKRCGALNEWKIGCEKEKISVDKVKILYNYNEIFLQAISMSLQVKLNWFGISHDTSDISFNVL